MNKNTIFAMEKINVHFNVCVYIKIGSQHEHCRWELNLEKKLCLNIKKRLNILTISYAGMKAHL